MRKLILFYLTAFACWQVIAGNLSEEISDSAKLLGKRALKEDKVSYGVDLSGLSAADQNFFKDANTPPPGFAKELEDASKSSSTLPPAEQKLQAAAELKAFRALPPAEQKQQVQAQFQLLSAKSQMIKKAEPTYFAPWAPSAKRLDWQARDIILKAQKPLTPKEIAAQLDIPTGKAVQMLMKDQSNERKVFFLMSNGKFWVSNSKLP